MINQNNKIAVLSLSGGMDSTSLLLKLLTEGYETHCISFSYGQKHALELKRAKKNIKLLNKKGFNINHKIIDLRSAMSGFKSSLTSSDIDTPEGFYAEEQMTKTVVPNRNAIFSSIIYGEALSLSQTYNKDVVITLGIHAGDHAIYPDCRQEFRDAIAHAFTIGNWGSERITYLAPYLQLEKYDILKDCLVSCEQLKLSFNKILKNTNTSYSPTKDGKASGKTGADVERILAFHKLGKKDPVEYVEGWDKALEYALKVEQEFKEKQLA